MSIKTIKRNRKVHPEVLKSLSDDELLELQALFQEDLEKIMTQLDEARIVFQTTGKYSDPQWFLRAQEAERGKKRSISQIRDEQDWRKARTRKTPTERPSTFNLIRAMNEILAPNVASTVIARANELEG